VIAIARSRIHNLFVIANQEIINAINEQIGNEFGAMLQYYAIAAHFDAEGLPDLSTHFYEQAEEEKKHALRIIRFVIDTGARVNIPAMSAPRAHFKVAEDAIKLSLEQEARVTTHTNALVSMARAAHFINDFKTVAESDRTAGNFLQWLVEKQSEEVTLLEQLLRAVQRTGEGNLLRVKEHLAHEKGPESASFELGQTVLSTLSALSEMVLAYRARPERDRLSDEEVNQVVSKTKASPEAGKAVASVVPDGALRDILKHLNEEIARLRASTADPSRPKAPHQRNLDRAEAEICVDLKSIQSHNNGVLPEVPALEKAWEAHRAHAFLTTSHA
jgi:bacterioferritin B